MRPDVKQSKRVGSYRLDAAKRLLTRSGESVALAPKTFDLLLLLIRVEGRVLTKTELMNALWGDTIVDESVLAPAGRPNAMTAIPRHSSLLIAEANWHVAES